MKIASIPLPALVSALSFSSVTHAQNFDGPSVGVQAGWVQNKVRNPETNLGVTPIDASKSSAMFGAYAGYDKVFGKAVLGGEADMNVGTSDAVSSETSGTSATINPKRSFDLTIRAGYLLAPTTLVYARGGYTNDRIRTTLVSATGTTYTSENRDGWLIGGGVERAIAPHAAVRVEYRYADLSKGDGKYDRNEVLTGVTYRL